MGQQSLPFNIKLMDMEKIPYRTMRPVTTLDTFENANSTNFHEDGLFSVEIFGRVGDDLRDSRFSYIPIKVSILHPVVFARLEKIKRLYIGILSGKEYAAWDESINDFVSASETTGDTGYHFFMSHWDELEFKSGNSEVRKQRIDMLNIYRSAAVMDKILVMPAGLRDIEIDASGRIREDEINGVYRRIISISNTIGKVTNKEDPVFNTARWSLQAAFNEVYAIIEKMLMGKKGFLQNKWGTRRIFDGTRNVITATTIGASSIDDPSAPGPNDTVVGLWQASRGLLPISIHGLKTGILADVFGSVEGQAKLIDMKTLELEFHSVSPQTYDRWMTAEGLEKVISLQKMVGLRAKPVVIEDRYLALVYRPKNKMVFKVFNDISSIPEWVDKEDIHPITYEELIYLSNYREWNKYKAIVTRYPVSGEGSTYPSNIFVQTTIKTDVRVELDMDWVPMEAKGNTALAYPNFETEVYMDSTSVHPYRLAGLNGDYDGDMVSVNFLYTKESLESIDAFFNTREAYVDPAGGLRASANIDTTALVMHNLTE